MKHMSIIQNYIHRNANNPDLLDQLKGRSLNKTTLAELASVGYRVVHMTDLALYDAMPPTLAEFMNKHGSNGITRNTYANGTKLDWAVEYLAYKEFLLNKLAMRLSKDAAFGKAPWLVTKPSLMATTFVDWREQVASSQMEFSKLFLINPTILQHFESGATQNLPVVIIDRLSYFGMPQEYSQSGR
jgi:hypothetical protein